MQKRDKLWGGRFQKETDAQVEQFTQSVSLDRRLYKEDIRVSLAHAGMLTECRLLTEAELGQIRQALQEIEQEIEAGSFEFQIAHEDVHTNIDVALIDRIGEVGLKLHTARSRNDQVACDMKLWSRAAIEDVSGAIEDCQRALLERAETFQDLIMPGYTHLQHAQPVLLAHVLLAYVGMLQRDRGRLEDCRRRLNVSPLGACALAGTTLPIDPARTAKELSFDAPFDNSVDAVADRDFVVEFASALSLVACHLSRLAEEWCLWASSEFDFLDLDEAFCTGSSIMPQKKNPDVLELVRGKTGRVYGNLTALLTMLKGLPLAYNRDMQEDKAALFEAFDEVKACLSVLADLVASSTFKQDRLEEACGKGYLDATALAEYLVARGVPFREAHRTVGAVVRRAAADEVQLSELSLNELRGFSELIAEDVYRVLGARNCIENYRSRGSSSPGEVARQIARWRSMLGEAETE